MSIRNDEDRAYNPLLTPAQNKAFGREVNASVKRQAHFLNNRDRDRRRRRRQTLFRTPPVTTHKRKRVTPEAILEPTLKRRKEDTRPAKRFKLDPTPIISITPTPNPSPNPSPTPTPTPTPARVSKFRRGHGRAGKSSRVSSYGPVKSSWTQLLPVFLQRWVSKNVCQQVWRQHTQIPCQHSRLTDLYTDDLLARYPSNAYKTLYDRKNAIIRDYIYKEILREQPSRTADGITNPDYIHACYLHLIEHAEYYTEQFSRL